jgi:flagellar export protein FliJ
VKSFKFSLESALSWRKTALLTEQEKLQRVLSDHQRLEADLRAADAAKRGAVRTQLDSPSLSGADFRMIASYLVGLQAKHAQLQLALAQSSQKVQWQRAICLEAERQFELLQTLKDKRQATWQHEADLELESIANDSYLARRARENR